MKFRNHFRQYSCNNAGQNANQLLPGQAKPSTKLQQIKDSLGVLTKKYFTNGKEKEGVVERSFKREHLCAILQIASYSEAVG